MTISDKDLFLAILSMDSYNRGYEPGLSGLGGVGTGTGSATFFQQSEVLNDSAGVAAGFYAAAYATQWGTVISYRGTDFNGIPSLADVTHGWPIGGGSYTADQFKLSTDFLEQVAIAREGLANITLTGHSHPERCFGGGLAGRGGLFAEGMPR